MRGLLSQDDRRISPQNSVLFAQELEAAKVPAQIHLFTHGVHGAGLAGAIPDEQVAGALSPMADWPRFSEIAEISSVEPCWNLRLLQSGNRFPMTGPGWEP